MTGDQKLSEGTLARVMRVVLSGDRQEIIITPISKNINAAQALLPLAARVEHNRSLQGIFAPSPSHRTSLRKSPDHNYLATKHKSRVTSCAARQDQTGSSLYEPHGSATPFT